MAPSLWTEANQQLRSGSEEIPLAPRTFAILQYLAENSLRLVTHAELFEASHPRPQPHPNLRDDAANPKFIATHHHRGFRFLVDVDTDTGALLSLQVTDGDQGLPPVPLVGRDQDLLTLHSLLTES